MGWSSISMLVVAVVLWLYAQSCNGRGESAGCLGMLALLGSACVVVLGLIFGAVWLGMIMKG
jgi:hypothetical protein